MTKRIWDLSIEELAEIGRAAAQEAIRSDRATRASAETARRDGPRKSHTPAAE